MAEFTHNLITSLTDKANKFCALTSLGYVCLQDKVECVECTEMTLIQR